MRYGHEGAQFRVFLLSLSTDDQMPLRRTCAVAKEPRIYGLAGGNIDRVRQSVSPIWRWRMAELTDASATAVESEPNYNYKSPV